MISDVDIRSEKINLKKLEIKNDVVKPDEHITLLELAERVLSEGHELKLPQYIVEENTIISRIKPRFYSIINDPFESKPKTNRLDFVFSDTFFEKNS